MRVKSPSCQGQTGWLFTSMAEDLNSVLLRKNLSQPSKQDLNWELVDFQSGALHAASMYFLIKFWFCQLYFDTAHSNFLPTKFLVIFLLKYFFVPFSIFSINSSIILFVSPGMTVLLDQIRGTEIEIGISPQPHIAYLFYYLFIICVKTRTTKCL